MALSRPVTAKELPSLGFEGISFHDIPMALAIVKGDFDVSNLMRGSPTHQKPVNVKYIAYIFDLQIGAPTFIGTSSALSRPSPSSDNSAAPPASGQGRICSPFVSQRIAGLFTCERDRRLDVLILARHAG